MGVSQPEIAAIVSGGIPVKQSVMKKLYDGIVDKAPKPHVPSKRSLITLNRKPRGRGMLQGNAQDKLNTLAKRYASSWKGFSSADYGDVAPEDAAPDAALGFFHEYPEWEELARIARMQKHEVQSMVTDYVYDAMMR